MKHQLIMIGNVRAAKLDLENAMKPLNLGISSSSSVTKTNSDAVLVPGLEWVTQASSRRKPVLGDSQWPDVGGHQSSTICEEGYYI